jgi:hypothetical protein
LEAEMQALMLEIQNEGSMSYKMDNPPPGGGGGTPISHEESLYTTGRSSTITARYNTLPTSNYDDMKMCMPDVPDEPPLDVVSTDGAGNLVEEKKGV